MKKRFLLSLMISLSVISVFSQNRSFTGKPMYQIQTRRAGNYLGTITVELFPAIAPLHVNNFDSLVSTQFYDSTAFHRVIPGFMIQGGDPNSRSGPISTWGMGDSTQPTVNAEFTAARHLRGILSAARDVDTNSANSQFFICVAPASWLNGQYSVYGRVTAGMNIVDTIVTEPRDANDNPLQKIDMFITYIGSNDTLATVPVLTQPADNSVITNTVSVLKWAAQSDGIIYRVQVSTDSTFATTYRSLDVGINQYTVTGLSAGNTYYWRVKSNNGGDTSAWSTVWRLNVSAVGIQSYEEEASFTISPNPASGKFLCSGMERGSIVEVFDLAGNSVAKTVAASSSCEIDLSGKARGVYSVSVTGPGGEVQRRKLILQ